MNFFKEQERVRQRTRYLIAGFYSVVLLTSLFTATVLYYLTEINAQYSEYPLPFYQTPFYWMIFLATFIFITLMSLIRIGQLKSGPDSIAKMAGALPLPIRPIEISHKRLLNIVEEMSIAAGIIPPRIYIMPEEQDINAFAAGFTIQDAIIGVSQGCLTKLTRDELQAVVAHEIGHIVNGDMKLNLELIGYLFGLMSIHVAGMEIIKPRRTAYLSNSKDNKRNSHAGLFFGLALVIIGFLGHLLALILKLAISRGQEFNADAKSVQFTRNPDGLAGALKKILVFKNSFKINSPSKQQLNHLYFYYPTHLQSIFSTHPPLEMRIKKIEPSFRLQHFKQAQELELKQLMNTNLAESIESSFFATPVSDILKENKDYYQQALAFFHLISKSSQKPKDQKILYYYERMAQLESKELLKEMDIILGRLRSVDQLEIRQILKVIKSIILEDKIIIASETLCFTLFKEVLIPQKKRNPTRLGLHNTKIDITIIMSFLAIISSDSVESQIQSFKIGMREIYPNEDFDLVEKIKMADLNSVFERLKDIVPLGREKVFTAANKAIINEKKENFNQELFLKVLAKIMVIPT